MSWICIQPRPTTNQGIQPRPPPSVDIAIIADITFLYVNVMLSASQLHFFGYLLCTLYFSRLDGKDQLQYSWVQNASRWVMILYLYWPLYSDGRDQGLFIYLWKMLLSCRFAKMLDAIAQIALDPPPLSNGQTWNRGERILFFGPNTNTNNIRNQILDRIRILIIFAFSQWANTNTNDIRAQIFGRIRIRIIFGFRIVPEYEYK